MNVMTGTRPNDKLLEVSQRSHQRVFMDLGVSMDPLLAANNCMPPTAPQVWNYNSTPVQKIVLAIIVDLFCLRNKRCSAASGPHLLPLIDAKNSVGVIAVFANPMKLNWVSPLLRQILI